MRISVVAETKKLTKHLNRIQKKQIPFATSKALNDVAFDARLFIQKSLPRKLDRPTKGIISSVQVEKSKKKNLVAIVGFAGLGFRATKWSESPAKIMRRHIQGGTRSAKNNPIPVPIIKNIKLNKFGNLPRTKIKTLLGKPDKYFSGKPKGRDAGVYERIKTKNKRGLKMLVNFEKSTQYESGRFPLRKIVEAAIRSKYRKRFDAALNKALKTAL
jgi:hypothetical protein